MRMSLAFIAALICGCGRASEDSLTAKVPVGNSAKSSIRLSTLPKATYAPSEVLEFAGVFQLAEGAGLHGTPHISIMSNGVAVDQVRGKLSAQEPGGDVPFDGKGACPKRPGRYTLVASITTAPTSSEKPEDQIVSASPPIEFEVAQP